MEAVRRIRLVTCGAARGLRANRESVELGGLMSYGVNPN